jgi:NAD(P)-dependent dehydrogenase (short-subunit alcohol dehydrogenase family)
MLDTGEIDALQAIVCNAGVQLNGPVSYSADGYEETFATNYLGHCLLVALLAKTARPPILIGITISLPIPMSLLRSEPTPLRPERPWWMARNGISSSPAWQQ